MAAPRALGANARLIGITEATYGTAPADGYFTLPFKSCDLDLERPIGEDPLLGQGRAFVGTYYDRKSVSGNVVVPLDVRALGFWLHGLMGAPTTSNAAATGEITFSAQPANNSTITLNGTVWTFVTTGAAGNQTNIGANLDATVTALASDLNASADAEVAKCTYTADTANDRITIVHDTVGTGGNSYTLAASGTSNGTVSAATLLGGGYSHQFEAGGAVPSKTLEIGHTALATPRYHRYLGCVLGGLEFTAEGNGPANATIPIIGRDRTEAAATIDGTPTGYTLARFMASRASIVYASATLAAAQQMSLNFTNSLDPATSLNPSGLIDGVDAMEAKATGALQVYYSDAAQLASLRAAIDAESPIALQLRFDHPARWSLVFDLPRVFLSAAKAPISGPGRVVQDFQWQAEHDGTYMLRATLLNDVASYA